MSVSFYNTSRLGLQPHWYVKAADNESISDSEAYGLMKGTAKLERPLRLKLCGKKKSDALYGLDMFFINTRIVELLKSQKLTGWDLCDVEITSTRALSEKFYGLVIRGRAGPLLEGPSGPIKFALSGWDKSDLFLLEKTALIISTERVRSAFEENGISGVWFEEITAV
jgi:hypothetical protein